MQATAHSLHRDAIVIDPFCPLLVHKEHLDLRKRPIDEEAQLAAAGLARETAAAVVIHNPGGARVLLQRRRGPRFNIATTREQAMRNRKAAEANADVEARIAQIEQMSLDQIAVFQCRILTEITKGRIAPREASALDRALRKRLKAIEQQLREGG